MIREMTIFCLVALSAAATPALAQDDTINELVRPKGPSLTDTASAKYQTFDATLPAWFKANIRYEPTHDWGNHVDHTGYFASDFAVHTTIENVTEDGVNWRIERARLTGYRSTVRTGTLHVVFKVEAAASAKMLQLYRNALDLWSKNTMKEVVDSQDKSVLKFLAEQVPIAGEIIEKGTVILSMGDLVDKMTELKAGLKRFTNEYDRIKPLLGKPVVTVSSNDYDHAVFHTGVRAEFLLRETKTRAIDDTFTEGVEDLGELGVPDGHRVFDLYSRPLAERDVAGFVESVYAPLDGWVGVWQTNRGGLTITRAGARLTVTCTGGGLLERRGGKVFPTYADATILRGRWTLARPWFDGRFVLERDGMRFTGRFSELRDAEPDRPWSGIKNR